MFNCIRAILTSVFMFTAVMFFITTLWAYLLIWFSDIIAFVIIVVVTLTMIKKLYQFHSISILGNYDERTFTAYVLLFLLLLCVC